MEVCSRPSTDPQGYEMRVGSGASVFDQLPDYTNIRKSHCLSSNYSTPTPPPSTLGTDMKRSHSERDDGNPKKSNPAQKLFSTSAVNQKQQKGPCSLPPSQQPECTDLKSESEFQNNNTSMCNPMTDCEIFLGGSCNPTSWRRDIAIPILKHSGISFFNPQVASWCPELMAAEHEAKDLANFLFFVIDSETRAVAAMVEVAYLVGQGKNVILVMSDTPRPGHVICGESLSESEVQDLSCAHRLLRDLSMKHGVRVFDCIRTALNTTAGLIKSPSDEQNGRTGACDVQCRDDDVPNSIPTQILPVPTPSESYDVFLGGSLSSDSWRSDEALPLLKKHGMSSWSPSHSSCLLDDKRMGSTSVLFFYLPNSSRELETLILAAYFVGLNKDVVLCIENLKSGCEIAGEKLTELGIKDYNRGRSYLRDVAERKGIPVFTTLSESLNSLVDKLGSGKIQS